MKLITIKRITKQEKRYTEEIGMLNARVTYIKQTFLNIPIRTLHSYRETYYGEVKDCCECVLSR